MKKPALILAAFLICNIALQACITEIVNNTDEAISIHCEVEELSQRVSYCILTAQSLNTDQFIQQELCKIYPRTKSIIHGLKIPMVDVNQPYSINGNKGISFYVTGKYFVDYSTGFFMERFAFCTLRLKGDLLSILSRCGSIKNFNFFGVDVQKATSNNSVFEGFSGCLITNKATYTLEINQLLNSVPRRGDRAYKKDSFSVILRTNNISSIEMIAKLNANNPIASIESFTSSNTSQGLTTAKIKFNTVITPLYIGQFCDYIQQSKIGKYFTMDSVIARDSSVLLTFYTQLNREDLQFVLDQANKRHFIQYNFNVLEKLLIS